MALEDSNRAEMAMTEPRFARSMLLACAMACATAGAQQSPQPAAAASAAERAQREADRTMYWIRVVGARPTPAPAKAAPTAATARPATPTPTHEVARTSVTPAPASPPPTPAVTIAAASPPAAAAQALDRPAPAPDIRTAGTDPVQLPPQDTAPAVADEPDPGLVRVASVEPDFPADLVRRLHKGNVEIRFEVDVDGKVSNAVVVDTSHSHLNHAALLAVRQWRFKPTPMTHVALVNLVFDTDKAQ